MLKNCRRHREYWGRKLSPYFTLFIPLPEARDRRNICVNFLCLTHDPASDVLLTGRSAVRRLEFLNLHMTIKDSGKTEDLPTIVLHLKTIKAVNRGQQTNSAFHTEEPASWKRLLSLKFLHNSKSHDTFSGTETVMRAYINRLTH